MGGRDDDGSCIDKEGVSMEHYCYLQHQQVRVGGSGYLQQVIHCLQLPIPSLYHHQNID